MRARGLAVAPLGLALAPAVLMAGWPSPVAGAIGALSAVAGVWLALCATRREAGAASREASAGLAMIAHELRTPIASVLGHASRLQDEPEMSASALDGVRAIRRNAEHLLVLANDVLDTARIGAGAMAVERARMDPAAVIGEALEACRPMADAKGLALSAMCVTPIPRQIESDPVRVRQIVLNLVANAIAYTTKGSVRVDVSAEESRVRVDVVDTGIGMNAEQVGRLFRPFARVGGGAARPAGGTGLGLHIARDLARRLGGDITVSSREGMGSTLSATIAMGSASGEWHTPSIETPEEASPEVRTQPGDLAGIHVLVAEDSPDILRLLRHHLERAGAAVLGVSDSESALRELLTPGSGRPSIALIDLHLPGMDGCEVALRARGKGATMPLIALTASSGERSRCLAAGFDGFATKPIEPGALVALCERWGRRHGQDAA